MEKDAVRQSVWDDLEERGIARFPFPPHGRIPNFAGAKDAADRLSRTEPWRQASTLKANPDAPQRPVRKRALQAGKRLYMAVPRLRDPRPFIELDPAAIDDVGEASTIGGASDYGRPAGLDEMPAIDLVVSGSVAVDESGGRVGKGEGYSDLEYAILSEYDRLDRDTPVVTTVHERQVWPERLETEPHDVPMDRIVTPDRVVDADHSRTAPAGIDWSVLDEATIDEIPVLSALRSA